MPSDESLDMAKGIGMLAVIAAHVDFGIPVICTEAGKDCKQ